MTESSLFVISEGEGVGGQIRDFVTGGRGRVQDLVRGVARALLTPSLPTMAVWQRYDPQEWVVRPAPPQLTWCKMETKEENFSARWSSGRWRRGDVGAGERNLPRRGQTFFKKLGRKLIVRMPFMF